MSTNQKWDRQTAQALPDMEVTHFHFLRHGRVETGGKRLVYGHLDLPLSEEGWQQGRRLTNSQQKMSPKPMVFVLRSSALFEDRSSVGRGSWIAIGSLSRLA